MEIEYFNLVIANLRVIIIILIHLVSVYPVIHIVIPVMDPILIIVYLVKVALILGYFKINV
jgi:hypothetical protein